MLSKLRSIFTFSPSSPAQQKPQKSPRTLSNNCQLSSSHEIGDVHAVVEAVVEEEIMTSFPKFLPTAAAPPHLTPEHVETAHPTDSSLTRSSSLSRQFEVCQVCQVKDAETVMLPCEHSLCTLCLCDVMNEHTVTLTSTNQSNIQCPICFLHVNGLRPIGVVQDEPMLIGRSSCSNNDVTYESTVDNVTKIQNQLAPYTTSATESSRRSSLFQQGDCEITNVGDGEGGDISDQFAQLILSIPVVDLHSLDRQMSQSSRNKHHSRGNSLTIGRTALLLVDASGAHAQTTQVTHRRHMSLDFTQH